MSASTLLLVVGLIAGWLAGQVVKGTGFGLVADIAIGIVGALIGNWLLPRLGIISRSKKQDSTAGAFDVCMTAPIIR